ncbi:hypothetical protein [Brevundimonas diminuta]|uniref:hypothetical protein n=1 Tax=Brevundimonas diminuta TaxID=293 RepID=UPI003D016871
MRRIRICFRVKKAILTAVAGLAQSAGVARVGRDYLAVAVDVYWNGAGAQADQAPR